jgi:hypothetical protein
MTEVYKFFGFGDNFINIMDTIGTNRKASIIFDDGSISPEFDLETGRLRVMDLPRYNTT